MMLDSMRESILMFRGRDLEMDGTGRDRESARQHF
jgi:hypothetical protein